MTNNNALLQIKKIWAGLPGLACKGLCHHSCRGIQLSTTEMHQIRKRKGVAFVGNRPDEVCPFLDVVRKTCTVYDIRPTVCRLWGATERMQCPHDCEPEWRLTDFEEATIINEVQHIGGSYSDAEYWETKSWIEDPELFPIIQQAMRMNLTGIDWDKARQMIERIKRERDAQAVERTQRRTDKCPGVH